MERFRRDNEIISKPSPVAGEVSDEEKGEKDIQVEHTVFPVQDEEEERFEWREVWRGKRRSPMMI